MKACSFQAGVGAFDGGTFAGVFFSFCFHGVPFLTGVDGFQADADHVVVLLTFTIAIWHVGAVPAGFMAEMGDGLVFCQAGPQRCFTFGTGKDAVVF